MLDFPTIHCPSCGEPQVIAVDPSAGGQSYVEDCQVCCRPMQVHVQVDDDGAAQVIVRGEDDT